MKKITSFLIGAGLLFSAHLSWSETVYKIERNGVTTYSFTPIPGAQAVKLPELSVIPGHQSTPHTPRTRSGMQMPPPPAVPQSINPNTMRLPPPPPGLPASLQNIPTPSVTPTSSSSIENSGAHREARRAAIEADLLQARQELEEQQNVRYGNERNYQRKLDRLKPFEDKVRALSQQLEDLKKR